MRDFIATTLCIFYLAMSITTFGYSANDAIMNKDVVSVLNTASAGLVWPLYISYIYFREKSFDKM